ncbi:phosphoglycolate phosphatase-like HAD superfamily hydrolase [Amycolatopsis cihanbeyliensis]|uniref:Phosphoglycolate phosphatase-like HAD superfamily hydrolase n=1 Tax=Amycolatopsis cihanbeyliensis TaxID=1128664 RepID=A0A542DGR7_AMYCI|nr:phosphoglycolate phosphatase-like HAD superfamily hydrolase [Amycolatopsis cihanbeyliensis]
MANEHRLVLWDIDLTLVDLRGLGGQWYTQALSDVVGVTLREMPSFPGRTERAITTELLTRHRIEVTDEVLQQVWGKLVAISTEAYPTLAEHGHALPGAAAALSTMAAQGTIVQSLVTGNLPEIARHKLSAFDLHEHIEFDIGGYGYLSASRPELVAHAVASASTKHARSFEPESVVIVGDTPHDIDAALRHGATGIGVATGRNSERELWDAGAHAVFADLGDTAAVLAAVTRQPT